MNENSRYIFEFVSPVFSKHTQCKCILDKTITILSRPLSRRIVCNTHTRSSSRYCVSSKSINRRHIRPFLSIAHSLFCYCRLSPTYSYYSILHSLHDRWSIVCDVQKWVLSRTDAAIVVDSIGQVMIARVDIRRWVLLLMKLSRSWVSIFGCCSQQ